MRLRGAYRKVQWAEADWRIRRQVSRIEEGLSKIPTDDDQSPVVFFNASTRLYHLSLNAAFSLLASWRLRSEGIPVRYFVCHAGLVQCVLGTHPDGSSQPPPCRTCIRYSRGLFRPHLVDELRLHPEEAKRAAENIRGFSLEELISWEYREFPLGEMVLPGLRWALRRHSLEDDARTRELCRQYLISAVNIVHRTEEFCHRMDPQAMVVFNGVMYPEAVVRAVAQRCAVRVVTHEVGLQPRSAYFTNGLATFRDVPIAGDARLNDKQQARLNRYLQGRREGQFNMAGVRFWPEIRSVPNELLAKLDQFRQVVPVFTNVVFDTSQVHANTIYSNMFLWLDDLAKTMQEHEDTFFVIRAHPDEDRRGKASRESVSAWVQSNGIAQRENVEFIGPSQYLSSYELIDRAEFVLVYNSSIGLEAAIAGVPVLCAGRARYTEAGIGTFPQSRANYQEELSHWLQGDIRIPEGSAVRSRQFLHNELFRASLDLSGFLGPYPGLPGMVTFSRFHVPELLESQSLSTIRNGIMLGKPFALRGEDRGTLQA